MPFWPFILSACIVAADQITKHVVVGVMSARDCRILSGLPQACRPIEVAEHFNLVMVWNTGVSFGLFSGGASETRFLLGAMNLIVALGILIWLARSGKSGRLLRLSLALIAAGAIGNAIDRFVWGAVADFLDLYLTGAAADWAIAQIGGNHWPAFNVADMAISAGVIGLIADSLFPGGEGTKRAA